MFNASLMLIWNSIHNRSGRNLHKLLVGYTNQQCKDPRKRFVAFLGLVPDMEKIKSNYDISVAKVYIETVKILARNRYRDWVLPRLHTMFDRDD
jgi:hypothetical protein